MKPFLTGTRYFGDAIEDSDWDICIEYPLSCDLKFIFKLLNIDIQNTTDEYESESFYVILNNKKVNFIVLSENEMIYWKYATKKISTLDYSNRKEKLYVFDKLKGEAFEFLRGILCSYS